MWVFAHLRKCAGTSVVDAAVKAGLTLPPRHRNGHPVGPDGHAIGGMSAMSAREVEAIILPLVEAGVQFMALEWDFPRIEVFPGAANLQFFTIFRDPVDRFLSNYAYDITSGFTPSRTVADYMSGPSIWRFPNYYTRFFAGLRADEPVGACDVEYALAVLKTRFTWAFFEDDDLRDFLANDVGLPVLALGRSNKTNGVLRFVHRAALRVSESERDDLRRLNAEDYALLAALRDHRAAAAARSGAGAGGRMADAWSPPPDPASRDTHPRVLVAPRRRR